MDNLGLDYLDLYLIHWPTGLKKPDDITNLFPKDENGDMIFDPVSPTDTWLAMEKLVELGLCKSIGLSNFNSEQIEAVLKCGKVSLFTLKFFSKLLNQIKCFIGETCY